MDSKEINSDRGGLFKLPEVVTLAIITIIPVAFIGLIMEKLGSQNVSILGFAFALSIALYLSNDYIIPRFKDHLLKANLSGKDLNKPGKREDKPPIPESMGIVSGATFIVAGITTQLFYTSSTTAIIHCNAGLLAITNMVLLGFADCVFNLRWRYKLILPFFAALPLVVCYTGATTIVIPGFLKDVFGSLLNVGLLYHLYMIMYAIFTSNAINIYAGVNGIEVGQSIVTACGVAFYNVLELYFIPSSQVEERFNHIFSLSLILPFIGVSLALFKYNKYPSQVFVGDTYTYFAGMVFAVVGILGHFTKTLLLLFIPQVLNFVLSLPQLVGIIPCPRHRLPKLNEKTLRLEGVPSHHTLINGFLRVCGPTNERQTVNALLLFQVMCCILGLVLRYQFSDFLFG